ncbi:MAG TPA: sugar ABC transporter substrate-binding protein [Anaerolineae bacterium]|nr:sugar ABC transporter substrate-binding protein [Anaerolineae bacterium]
MWMKRLGVWCALLGMVLLIAGCEKVLPTPEPVIITFVHPQDRTGQYQTWAEQFHAQYPHITVELVPTENSPSAQAKEKDTFITSQFELASLLQQGVVMNLASFIEQDESIRLDDFYPGTLDVFVSEGKRWALPFGVDMMMMYYNKDLFNQAGADYPQIGWTWGDFLESALAVTNPPNGYGYAVRHDDAYALYEGLMLMYQHGGKIFDSMQNPMHSTLNDPLNIEAMEFYASLMYQHEVAPTAEEAERQGQAYPWRGIYEGRFGMWMGMYSERGGQNWPRPWQINWGVVPMPRDENAATLGTVSGLFITAHTTHPDECWLWIKFLSQQMSAGLVPARQSLATSTAYAQLAEADVVEAAQAAMQETMMVNPALVGFDEALGALGEALKAIRKGEVTPAEALDAAQEKGGF